MTSTFFPLLKSAFAFIYTSTHKWKIYSYNKNVQHRDNTTDTRIFNPSPYFLRKSKQDHKLGSFLFFYKLLNKSFVYTYIYLEKDIGCLVCVYVYLHK